MFMNRYEIVNGLKPESLWKYFVDISMIPRVPGVPENQREISDYIFKFAKNLGLDAVQDDYLNVIARKPASVGYENSAPIILQAHLDMVCEKHPDVVHDFKKDPLKLIIVDDKIMADGTTLGADDGIGVAFIMAILADKEIMHPEIEAIFTTDEETDMGGAFALDYTKLKSKLVINLDAGAVGVCGSGELEVEMNFKKQIEKVKSNSIFGIIKVSGLMGGHTGGNAMNERGNAIVLLNRILLDLNNKGIDFQIVSINGGAGMSSAFARDSQCIIAFEDDNLSDIKSIVENNIKILCKEMEKRDPGFKVAFSVDNQTYQYVLDEKTKNTILDLLCILPDGVFSLNKDFEDTMESCSNVGVIETREDIIFITTLIRSFVPGKKYYLYEKVIRICDLLGIEHKIGRDLPHWDYKINENLLNTLDIVYPEVEKLAIPGTLEAGIFNNNIPDSCVISLGSSYYDAHSPYEHLFISETKKSWDQLLEFLERLK